MGGRQYWPFMLTPPGLLPADVPIEDPMDFHRVLRKYDGED
jgi:hypothetical protein